MSRIEQLERENARMRATLRDIAANTVNYAGKRSFGLAWHLGMIYLRAQGALEELETEDPAAPPANEETP